MTFWSTVQHIINILYGTLVKPLHLWFNEATEGIDFFALCLVYTLVFLFVAWRTYRAKKWVGPFHELLTFRERVGAFGMKLLRALPIISSVFNKKLAKEESKASKLFDEEFEKSLDARRANCLPENGMNPENLRRRIDEWTKKEYELTRTHKISGSIYYEDEELFEATAAFAKNYLYQNPLHLDTFKELLRMESEVIQMTADLLSPGVPVFGSLTSGGTESIMLAIYAYKQYYSNRTRPNIVIANSAHAAFDKGCFYFNVELRKARLTSTYVVDVKHLESLIDSNTIMISGSAPCFPYGTIDPIPKLAQIAKKRNVGMHVDACLGGFVVAFAEQLKLDIPFNFKIDGVTSISIDHHKYGLAPKGVSGLFFKTKELRGSGFFSYSDWCGGAYATPSMLGSRSGIATAGAWFVMNTITREGYKENARKLMETVVQTADQLRADGRIEVFGDPRICVVSFRPKDISSYKLSSFLGRERGWELSSLHRPEGIHISVTPSNQEKVRTNLVKDVKDGITAVIREPEKYKGSTEALYGGTANIPDTNVRESILKLILSSYLK